MPHCVTRIKLPRTAAAWEEANLFFCVNKPFDSDLIDIDICAEEFQNSIYKYSARLMGYIGLVSHWLMICDLQMRQ